MDLVTPLASSTLLEPKCSTAFQLPAHVDRAAFSLHAPAPAAPVSTSTDTILRMAQDSSPSPPRQHVKPPVLPKPSPSMLTALSESHSITSNSGSAPTPASSDLNLSFPSSPLSPISTALSVKLPSVLANSVPTLNQLATHPILMLTPAADVALGADINSVREPTIASTLHPNHTGLKLKQGIWVSHRFDYAGLVVRPEGRVRQIMPVVQLANPSATETDDYETFVYEAQCRASRGSSVAFGWFVQHRKSLECPLNVSRNKKEEAGLTLIYSNTKLLQRWSKPTAGPDTQYQRYLGKDFHLVLVLAISLFSIQLSYYQLLIA